jgi:hypothetical protein
MPPRRNTRTADNPHPLPRLGFQSVLNSLLAQRDAALGVTVPSQPIARWESSSQPEILWELLAERRRAGIPPSLSQEQNAAVEVAIAHIPAAEVNNTIAEMEAVVASSQGNSPALTVVSDSFWNALQAALPASGIPPVITQGPAFSQRQEEANSGGSSPMDTSSDGIVAPAPHSPSLVTPFPARGDLSTAPIFLSSDSDTTPPPLVNVPPHGVHEAPEITNLVSASPPVLPGGEADAPSANISVEGSILSNVTPIDSVSSWGRDAAHPLELSTDPSTHSSLRSSEIPDVPDMGPARRGGKMTMRKIAEELETAGLAVLARARYLNIVLARDTKSSELDLPAASTTNALLHQFAVSDLTDGKVFTYANMDTAHEEAIATLQGATDELSSVRMGFAHYFLRDPLALVNDPSVPIESEYLRKMADVVGLSCVAAPAPQRKVWTTCSGPSFLGIGSDSQRSR